MLTNHALEGEQGKAGGDGRRGGGQDLHPEEVPVRPVPAPALAHRRGDVQQGLRHQQVWAEVDMK